MARSGSFTRCVAILLSWILAAEPALAAGLPVAPKKPVTLPGDRPVAAVIEYTPVPLVAVGEKKTWCGDGWCEPWEGEDEWSCPDDCGWPPPPSEYCGDGSCNNGEYCGSCPGDCGDCPPGEWCGDGSCNNREDCSSCSGDCGSCAPAVICGDGQCAPGIEDCGTCLQDCPCWMDGTSCNASGSPGQCVAFCGNGVCGSDENCSSCASDCGACPVTPWCGDGACNNGEDCAACPGDCGNCPPPAEPSLTVYEDSDLTDAGTVATTVFAETDPGLPVGVTVETTDEGGAPLGSSSASGVSYVSSNTESWVPQGPEVSSLSEGGTYNVNIVVRIVVTVGGLIGKLWSKLKKVKITQGFSSAVYNLAPEYGILCNYRKMVPCVTACPFEPGPLLLEASGRDHSTGTCRAQIRGISKWSMDQKGKRTCGRFPVFEPHAFAPVCF